MFRFMCIYVYTYTQYTFCRHRCLSVLNRDKLAMYDLEKSREEQWWQLHRKVFRLQTL